MPSSTMISTALEMYLYIKAKDFKKLRFCVISIKQKWHPVACKSRQIVWSLYYKSTAEFFKGDFIFFADFHVFALW